jgi:hypothetical protein
VEAEPHAGFDDLLADSAISGGWWFLSAGAAAAAMSLVPAAAICWCRRAIRCTSDYTVTLLGKYLTTRCSRRGRPGLGLCGILSLGHGAFFALGGYAMGMYLMRQIGDRGVYGHPVLPDFMVFLNWQELPWYWWGFDMFWFAMLMVLLVPGRSPSCSAGWPSARGSPASISRSSPRR